MAEFTRFFQQIVEWKPLLGPSTCYDVNRLLFVKLADFFDQRSHFCGSSGTDEENMGRMRGGGVGRLSMNDLYLNDK